MWIAGITRGHNGGVCLMHNGQIVFAIEEERLSRQKYDGGPFAAMIKILDYTDHLDFLVIAHTQPLSETAGMVDYTGDDVYTGLARKLRLIETYPESRPHPQVIDLSNMHHKLHAACAFYRSGFESATAVIVDGAGTFLEADLGTGRSELLFELETIFSCEYPNNFKTLWKHVGGNGPFVTRYIEDMSSAKFQEEGNHICIIESACGLVKMYEAVTNYCGFEAIEAGKTMGLSSYGAENPNIPSFFTVNDLYPTANKDLFIPTYPNGALINTQPYSFLYDENYIELHELTKLQNRKDLAFAVQKETQQKVLELILYAVELTGNKNVVLSGGYGLNCVANYYYLDKLKKHDISLFVEPISSDAGTAIGAAAFIHYLKTNSSNKTVSTNLYLGLPTNYTQDNIAKLAKKYSAKISDCDELEIVNLLIQKNIVAIFQGRSENGPRALGNRSLLFDPRFKDGKDFVNKVKKREYFRPFAGTVLKEHASTWFDMKNLSESPHMMFAVDVLEHAKDKIPSIVHVDNTCRIQTVTEDQNPYYYSLIKHFYNETKVPILFNTSFNLAGEPLVETLEDALVTLSKSDIEYLYLPEYKKLIVVENES